MGNCNGTRSDKAWEEDRGTVTYTYAPQCVANHPLATKSYHLNNKQHQDHSSHNDTSSEEGEEGGHGSGGKVHDSHHTKRGAFGKLGSVMWHMLHREPFDERYEVGEELGEGALAVVRQGVRRKDGVEVAIKIMPKENLHPDHLAVMMHEVEILAQLKHPNIIRLEEFAEDKFNYYLVLEMIKGVELLERITSKSVYREQEARDLFVTLAKAVDYMHSQDVVHRDLKAENLVMSGDEDVDVKIADMGFAGMVKGDERTLHVRCGSPLYMAPEMLRGEHYGKPIDVWSLGVLTYLLLCGYPPFYDDDVEALFEKINVGEVHFAHENWYYVSDEAKDLVLRLLCTDADQRLTAEEALDHPWCHKKPEEMSGSSLEGTQHQLRFFNAHRKLSGGALVTLAANRLSEVMSHLSQYHGGIVGGHGGEEVKEPSQ